MSHYARTGTLYEVGLQELGERLLKDAFREASLAFLKGLTSLEVQQSVLFIRGSGVETIVETFGLAYDAEQLRRTFFRWSSGSPPSVSSSHITRDVTSLNAV